MRLHKALDALLDSRAKWDRVNVADSDTSVLGRLFLRSVSHAHLAEEPAGSDARELMGQAANFLRDVLGPAVRSAALQLPIRDGDGGKNVLSGWLRLLEPILDTSQPTIIGGAPDQYLALFEVFVGLSALKAGEVQPLFQPGERGNKPANAYSLALAKLLALEWKETLGALGYKDGEANNLISQAFGEQWDTIRKWRRSCATVLDEFMVSYCIRKAGDVSRYQSRFAQGFFGAPRTPEEDLRSAGNLYRMERRRAAEASRSKKSRTSAPAAFPAKLEDR